MSGSAVRTLLFTGKGGVGKTTTAAATALHAARRGRKTLVLSTDPAHSLGDALGVPLRGAEPTEIEPGLAALEVDTQARFERSWGEVQRYLQGLLTAAGADPLAADEVAVLPGAEEVMALLELRDRVAEGLWDLVVVDCAPTAETLRLLALPDLLAWYAERVFPTHSRVMRRLAPLLLSAGDLPRPADAAVSAFTAFGEQLAGVRRLLSDHTRTTVRLVLTPEALAVAEARRTHAALRLHGYHVDGLVVNRVVPGDGDDPWRTARAEAQRTHLEAVGASFPGLPVRTADHLPGEPVGAEALADLGARVYGEDDPGSGPAPSPYPRIDRVPAEVPGGSDFELALDLPHVDRADLGLSRVGDDLVVTVGGRRRWVGLPSALRRCEVVGARYDAPELVVRFTPRVDLWPAR